jgi:hypothetical protein
LRKKYVCALEEEIKIENDDVLLGRQSGFFETFP